MFDFELNVSCKNSRHLVSFSSEIDFVAILNTFVDVHMKYFSLDDGFLAVASLASVFVPDDLAFSLAIWAHGLKSLDHRPHLAHHGLHPSAIAARALFYGTLFSPTALTCRTDDGFMKSKL